MAVVLDGHPRMRSRPKVAALLNASAGTIEAQGEDKLRHALASAFEKYGLSATLEFLSSAELGAAARRALRRVKAQELDAIVVGGGDGSIRTLASVLADSGVPLGIIPLGTLNHFARDLGIPLDLDGAVALIAAGHAHSVDVGDVNGQIFINNSSIGIYPYLVLERERRRRRKRLAKWTAMILAGLRVLRLLQWRRLAVSAEGCSEPCRSPCVFIGNNEYTLRVPAFGRRERLDAGELCLYVAKARSRLALFWLACRTILGRLDQLRDIRVLKVSTAEISSRRSRLLVALDGEVNVLRTPLHYRTRPAALRVFTRPRLPSSKVTWRRGPAAPAVTTAATHAALPRPPGLGSTVRRSPHAGCAFRTSSCSHHQPRCCGSGH